MSAPSLEHAEYISSLAKELARIAAHANLVTASYLLEVAALAAANDENLSRHRQNQPARSSK